MTATIRRAAGSLLVVGLEGAELTSLERAWLKLLRPAGVILFRRNINDAKQTRSLLRDATALCIENSLRCVDVEGGTVDRLRDALAPMPSAQAVAVAARTKGNAGLAQQHGELIARGVGAFGLNTTLAPVVDLALPASAEVMGTRSVSADAAEIVGYARRFLVGLSEHGIAGCAKHFPGLGGGALDSHFETPKIRRNWKDLWREDLEPYRALRDELPLVMVNHAAYPATPGKERPASVSPFWITTVLRKRIGYRGLIFSDDLEMGGVLKYMPMEDAVVAAVRAGMDVMEICHSPELILKGYEALITEAEKSAAFRKLLLARAHLSARKRARIFGDGIPPALTMRQIEALRGQMLRFGETVCSRASGDRTVAVENPKQLSVVETA